MRRIAILLLMASVPAAAQSTLPPLRPLPPLAPLPSLPSLPPPASPAPASPAPVAPPAPAAPVETWLPRQTVVLAALDKVTARVTPLSGRVGETLNFGTLRIAIRACLARAPDQPADQAVFLDIADNRDPRHDFAGWMLLSAPSVSMLAHPIYDIRLTGCRA